jgi:hypothetical protein
VFAKENIMNRAFLPFIFLPSNAVCEALGGDLQKVAVLALQAVLRYRKTIEVAHQQITYREHHLAFSTRIGGKGDLIVEIDVGDPRLSRRVVLEEDFKRAKRTARNIRGERWRYRYE